PKSFLLSPLSATNHPTIIHNHPNSPPVIPTHTPPIHHPNLKPSRHLRWKGLIDLREEIGGVLGQKGEKGRESHLGLLGGILRINPITVSIIVSWCSLFSFLRLSIRRMGTCFSVQQSRKQ
ncbi:unnamed protein product, partial [Prunus brigantina]